MYRLRTLLGILFIVATLLGAMHHHEDLKSHNDCQVCALQLDLLDGDIPSEPVYLQEISSYSSPIIVQQKILHVTLVPSNTSARAPPFNA